ncbi:5'-methylthioadenosine/adenosylhomocysteine nucleosidase [[Clostridium] fimetarium]|uniref:adenosylhomocysteine nucleosidase n=1 Tax=[Clostridium] fimetarium TaxID=99656 RepID=A0A1I0QWU2_9FIRM|nr:5'-methylthioadenosine/adenosylhomocysteine nucleosidase [[Clostridium] fimetarium]SEW31991.1 adenosylhomocysteine nucleosidase [[Clostridium] fimetarium]
MIGIIGAMDEEVLQIVNEMEVEKVENKASMTFNMGKLSGKDVVIVRSGIGKVNAAVCTQILVDDFGVDYVINTGIAGSLKSEIDIADIVISDDVLHHDMDASGFGYALGQIPRMETLSFKADEKLIALAKDSCANVIPRVGVHIGRIVSGDQFISNKEVKDKIISNFSGYCTEMEGAAIAQAAYLNNVPFLILRAISDKADDSATMDYPTFEAQAIKNSVLLIRELVARI